MGSRLPWDKQSHHALRLALRTGMDGQIGNPCSTKFCLQAAQKGQGTHHSTITVFPVTQAYNIQQGAITVPLLEAAQET